MRVYHIGKFLGDEKPYAGIEVVLPNPLVVDVVVDETCVREIWNVDTKDTVEGVLKTIKTRKMGKVQDVDLARDDSGKYRIIPEEKKSAEQVLVLWTLLLDSIGSPNNIVQIFPQSVEAKDGAQLISLDSDLSPERWGRGIARKHEVFVCRKLLLTMIPGSSVIILQKNKREFFSTSYYLLEHKLEYDPILGIRESSKCDEPLRID